MLIGNRIKQARIQKGLSQEEVGNILGISRVSVCGYENGTQTPTLETFVKLIEFYEMDPYYALGIEIPIIKEEEVPYGNRVAKEDLQILEELKSHKELYNRLCVNPKRTTKIIASRMNLK